MNSDAVGELKGAGSVVIAAKGDFNSDALLKASQQVYPSLAGKTQLHHITPKYIGWASK